MKLINKFTLWYLCITFSCTLVGSVITYFTVKTKIDNASSVKLEKINDKVAEQVSSGQEPDSFFQGRHVSVKEWPQELPGRKTFASRVKFFNEASQQNECVLTVNSYYHINSKNYWISSYENTVQASEILAGIESSIFWKWLWVLCLIALSARLVSKKILAPFNKTLKIIESFSLRQKQKIQLPETRTKEFKELNVFLKKMTDKAVEDYSTLKEFSENASHELQTPVAVMRGKLDLLAESGLNDEQAILISDIQNSLEKLSRINKSLVLLTKLENHEYEAKEPVSLSPIVSEAINTYQELMALKNLSLQQKVQPNVQIMLHPMLTDLLLNNMFSNAIRHNLPGGQISVTLTPEYLQIKNTGHAPQVPVEQLFKRFKKSDQCANSVGIGLSIVKQICELNHFNINYVFEDGWHILTIHFTTVAAQPVDSREPVQNNQWTDEPMLVPAFS